MEHPFGSNDGLYDDSMDYLFEFKKRKMTNMQTSGKFSSAIAALTLAFSRGCGAEVNTDDILMVALKQLTPGKSFRLFKCNPANNSNRGSIHIHRRSISCFASEL